MNKAGRPAGAANTGAGQNNRDKANIPRVRRKTQPVGEATSAESEPLANSANPANRTAPEPLRRPTPPPAPYPTEALGSVLGPAAEAFGRVIQAPASIIGSALLAASSLATQAHADVHIDGRVHHLSLWLLSVAESGERKSAVDGEAMRAARTYENELEELFREMKKEFDNALKEFNARVAAAQKEAEANGGLGLSATLAALEEDRPQAPLIPRLRAADFTIEGLCKLLQDGQPSIGVVTDEAAQVFGGHGMNKETVMRTAAALSTLWGGGELDRIRVAGDFIPRLHGRRFALHLLAQPVIAAGAMSNSVLSGQGFLARCLIAWPNGTAGNREYVEESLRDDPAVTRLEGTLLTLHRYPLPLAKKEIPNKKDDEGNPQTVELRNTLDPPRIVLNREAKVIWMQLERHVERGMAKGGPYEQVKPWANKTAEQALRIAGVLTLVDAIAKRKKGNLSVVTDQIIGNKKKVQPIAEAIDADTIRRAGALALWYLGEAVRLVGTAELSPETSNAEALLNWCHETGREHLYSHDALRRGPSRIRERKPFLEAVKVLASAGWAVPVKDGLFLDDAHRKQVWRIVPVMEGQA